jgi:uncharacterized OB-fold protein
MAASDAFVVEGTFALPYNYFAGRVGSTWLVALRDERKIYGVRHPKTGKVFVPPRRKASILDIAYFEPA